ncbi:MAG: hypothetical protein V3T59_02620 [Desulfobacterales bacterium]
MSVLEKLARMEEELRSLESKIEEDTKKAESIRDKIGLALEVAEEYKQNMDKQDQDFKAMKRADANIAKSIFEGLIDQIEDDSYRELIKDACKSAGIEIEEEAEANESDPDEPDDTLYPNAVA